VKPEHSVADEPSESVAIAPGPLRALAVASLAIAGGALVLLAIVEVWQVFTRYVLDAPAGWTEPVALLLLKTALFLAAAVGVRHDAHFRFALLAEAAGAFWRVVLARVALLATAALGAVFAGWGAALVLATWAVKTPGAPFPVGLSYLPFAVGGVLFVSFAIERALALRAARPG